jgi:hypothetical protein
MQLPDDAAATAGIPDDADASADTPADTSADTSADADSLEDAGRAPSQDVLERTVIELEHHVAAGGWDGPIRVFALVRTADALTRDPQLATQLPQDVVTAAEVESDHLTAVEQEGLPDADSLESLLAMITWPPTVDGAAVVVERIVVPPGADSNLPDDPVQAHAALLNHPLRRDLRLAAAVLRKGGQACAIRARDHDSDDRVAVGPDLIPGLAAALAETLA